LTLHAAFLVNGPDDSPLAARARAFATGLSPGVSCSIHFRRGNRGRATHRFLRELRSAPDVVYVLDMAAPGVLAARLHRARSGTPWVVDTGDAVTAFARSTGRSAPGVALTALLETIGLRADALVVRGSVHAELLAAKGRTATVIQDGVHVDQLAPPGDTPRGSGPLVVGMLGSTHLNPRTGWSPGLELIEAIHRLRDLPIVGVVIGDGSGLPTLRTEVETLGLQDRIRLLGRIPHSDLPAVLHSLDVGLSTQTNDLVGQVRTTGKLPEYLAAGCFVLATRVGEAARCLPDRMLVPYHGAHDPGYPERLAERLRVLVQQPSLLGEPSERIALARDHFSYDVLLPRVRGVLHAVVG
jgi:glycosyltransferase involved in cell wall biosynthesis